MTNQISAFVDALNAKFDDYHFGVIAGRKNAKITRCSIHNGEIDEWSRSVFCFIRKEDGAILKAASWKAPAKGIRAWLDQVLASNLSEVDPYTSWLYRCR